MNSVNLKVFLGCLPGDTITDEITEYLKKYVQVTQIKIRFRSNGLCSGYGYAFIEGSNDCISLLLTSDFIYRGRKVECREYLSSKEFKTQLSGNKSRRVYISGLPVNYTDDSLREVFSKYGLIEKAYMANQEKSNYFDGAFGFVIFSDESAVKSITSNEVVLQGKRLTISIAKLKKKSNFNGNGIPRSLEDLEPVNEPQHHLQNQPLINLETIHQGLDLMQIPYGGQRRAALPQRVVLMPVFEMEEHISSKKCLKLCDKIVTNHSLGNIKLNYVGGVFAPALNNYTRRTKMSTKSKSSKAFSFLSSTKMD